jgi:hypothetical protein
MLGVQTFAHDRRAAEQVDRLDASQRESDDTVSIPAEHGPEACDRPRLRLNCPRCRLTITPRAQWLVIEHCPRCVARAHTLVTLFPSGLTAAPLLALTATHVPDRDSLS